MASTTATLRQTLAEQRRRELETRKRGKDLERRLKEHAKMTAQEQARLEVEAYENSLELLLSVHTEQSAPIRWVEFATAFPPSEPVNAGQHEFAAILRHGVAELLNATDIPSANPEDARQIDQRDQQILQDEYTGKRAELERMRALAKRVIAGESGAYLEAIAEFSSLEEVAGLGSSLQVTVHSPRTISCLLTVNGREAVPGEVKSLTAAGKLSVKAMPKPRFHEIYQDYVCGCVLRLGREMLSLLPIDQVITTASVHGLEGRTGKPSEVPVLSVAMDRSTMDRLDFERLDPSESMQNFLHRGDVKASRKSGEFVPISPLNPADLTAPLTPSLDIAGLLTQMRELRAEIASQIKPVPALNNADSFSSALA